MKRLLLFVIVCYSINVLGGAHSTIPTGLTTVEITCGVSTPEPMTIIEDVDAAVYQNIGGKLFTFNQPVFEKSFMVKLPKSNRKVHLQVKLQGNALKYGVEGKMYDAILPFNDNYKPWELYKVGNLFIYVKTYRDEYHKGSHDILFYISDKELPAGVLI